MSKKKVLLSFQKPPQFILYDGIRYANILLHDITSVTCGLKHSHCTYKPYFLISVSVDGILGQLNNLDIVDNSAIKKNKKELLRYVDFESSVRIQISLG